MAAVEKECYVVIPYGKRRVAPFRRIDFEQIYENIIVAGVKQVRGTFFYLHTPYYGQDGLCLEPMERERILKDLMRYRKRYRVLNSRAGLRSALRNDWKRPLDICTVYEKGKTYRCCRYSADPELCEQCGYLSYAEIDRVLQLNPSAMMNALKYF